MKSIVMILLVAAALGWGLVSQASPPPHVGPPAHAGVSPYMQAPPQATERQRFLDRDRQLIREWYAYRLPPGLAKQGKVPLGHAKRLAIGSPWPPGVPYEPLPRELTRKLQPLPPGYAYYRVGVDVIIADLAGRVVADIVYDLLQ